MAKISRRPNAQPKSSGGMTPDQVKKFNEGLRYVQGQRIPIAPGSNDYSINLTSAGKMLLGIAIIVVGTDNISDCQIDLSVNNNVMLKGVALQNLNPNYVSNMIFFPTPQPLSGKDTISGLIKKNNAGDVSVYMNIFYVSRLRKK